MRHLCASSRRLHLVEGTRRPFRFLRTTACGWSHRGIRSQSCARRLHPQSVPPAVMAWLTPCRGLAQAVWERVASAGMRETTILVHVLPRAKGRRTVQINCTSSRWGSVSPSMYRWVVC